MWKQTRLGLKVYMITYDLGHLGLCDRHMPRGKLRVGHLVDPQFSDHRGELRDKIILTIQ